MGERGALCILLMICIIGGAFLLGGLLFSRSVSTILQLVVAHCRWRERNLKFLVEALSSWNMSSERDINSTLVDAAKALSDIVSRLQASNGTTDSDLERARNAVRSLHSDADMANRVSQSFNRSSAAGNNSSSSRPTLPSVSRKQAPSHRFAPYSREKRKKKSAREPKRYDI